MPIHMRFAILIWSITNLKSILVFQVQVISISIPFASKDLSPIDQIYSFFCSMSNFKKYHFTPKSFFPPSFSISFPKMKLLKKIPIFSDHVGLGEQVLR